MSRCKPVKTLRQCSLEAVCGLLQAGVEQSATSSFEKLAGNLNSKTRVRKIFKVTDDDIQNAAQFVFSFFTSDVINNLIEIFSRSLSRNIEKLQNHKLFAASELDCFICHRIIVSMRFAKICFNSKVTKLDLDFVNDSLKRYLLREMSKCDGKKIMKLSASVLPIRIKIFNDNVRNSFSSLRYLKIDFHVENSTLEAIGGTCQLLEHLELDQCFTLNNHGLNKLVKGCKNIRVLLFGSPTLITDQGFANAMIGLPKLERIGRIGIMLISVIKLVHEKAPERKLKLKFLESNEKELITNDQSDLEVITRTCSDLSHISLSVYCPRLSTLTNLKHLNSIHLNGIAAGNHHKSLPEVFRKLGRQISTLELSTTAGISTNDLINIGRSCPYLECLILRSCSFAREQVDPIQHSSIVFPHLRIVYFSPVKSDKDDALDILASILTEATGIEELFIEECLDISDNFFLDLLESDGLQLLKVLQINSLNLSRVVYRHLTAVTLNALTDICQDLVEIGDINKWNIDSKLIVSLRNAMGENNFDLMFSNDSLLKFHEKYFCF